VAPLSQAQDEKVAKIIAEKGVKVHNPVIKEYEQWESAAMEPRKKFVKDYPDGERLFKLADEANAQYRAQQGKK
jgi:hypothetical protein